MTRTNAKKRYRIKSINDLGLRYGKLLFDNPDEAIAEFR